MDKHNSPNKIKIPVGALEIGMYVSELDKSWLESSFIYQGLMVETVDDIRLLEEECTFVWIDPVREQHSESRLTFKPPKKSQARYINKVSMPHEYDKSHDIFNVARDRTHSIMSDVALKGIIDSQKAKEVVESCLDSILRNPNAMLWMSKVRESNSYTAEHSLNVCILSIAFGRQLNMDEGELFSLGLCGLLHDVGKLRVPNEVLNKPSKLTPKEWKQMQAHVSIGRKLLMASTGIGYTVDVAYNHHERIDGTGYPRQLTGDKISQLTKIISLTDSFDAMTAERCYSKAMTPSAAVREIYKGRGTQFDDALTLKFIKSIGLYPPGTVVELHNGYLGLVMERSQKYQRLPKVLVLQDKQKKELKKKVIDLTLIEYGKLEKEFLIRQDHPDGYSNIRVADYQHFIPTLV